MFGALVKAGKAFAVLQGKIRSVLSAWALFRHWLLQSLCLSLSICREGLVFYSRVHDNVSKLRKRVFEVTGTRSRERENLERYSDIVNLHEQFRLATSCSATSSGCFCILHTNFSPTMTTGGGGGGGGGGSTQGLIQGCQGG